MNSVALAPMRRALRLIYATVCVLSLTSSVGSGQDRPRNLVGEATTGVVTTVIDGDTLDVRLQRGQRIRVRIFGIDAPERSEAFGTEAQRFSRSLLFGQTVRVDGVDVDRYGRLVARVTVGSQDAALALLNAGLACHFTQYSTDNAQATAQASAIARQAGFWAHGAARPRCAGSPATAQGPFHGNTSSHVYHAPLCPNYRCKNCTVVFRDAQQARAAGFRPARDCIK